MMRRARSPGGNRGFTLLEVLVALTVLSLVALLAIQAGGDSLSQIARTGWEDRALRLGRARLIRLLREEPRHLEQWGTLAPELPDVEWRSSLHALRGLGGPRDLSGGRRLAFTLAEGAGAARREVVLEYVLP